MKMKTFTWLFGTVSVVAFMSINAPVVRAADDITAQMDANEAAAAQDAQSQVPSAPDDSMSDADATRAAAQAAAANVSNHTASAPVSGTVSSTMSADDVVNAGMMPVPATADASIQSPGATITAAGGTVSKGETGIATDQTVPLAQAVAVGVSGNPEYGVVANNRRATDEELRQAKALYLPSIDLQADTGVEYTDDPNTRGGLDNDDTETMWRRQATLTLTQLLFDGNATKSENTRQQARVQSAANRVKETSELVGLNIVEDYLEVLRQRDLLKIARDNVAQHISIMGQINESSQAGRTTQADVDQARSREAAARAQEASVREALRVAEANYIKEVGDQPANLVMPVPPTDKLSKDVEEEVKLSLAQSPTIDIYEADMDVAHAEYLASKAPFYPKVELQLNGREADDVSGIDGRDTSAAGLLVMNWNLYRGGGDTARVREQISREAQTKSARAQAARGVENDVRLTWARMISAGERARQFAAQADANAEVVKAYRDQFDLNRRTLLDVLDSQNESFVSRSAAIDAEYLEMFAVYRLLALKGELLNTLGVPHPRESDVTKM